ncbi:MAG: DNA methyltransferase [Ruminococcaceae bacterium]|nr:DNA methyltransferase [Oscillospiraceae bacterium]
MADNASLGAAKTAKNDEFYTQYSDIEAEMNAYVEFNPDVFRGKIILLPCDDPEWSNFTKYFAANFERFGLKKLISTSYAKGAGNRQLTIFEMMSPLYDEEKHETRGKLFTLTSDKDGSGIIDTDDIEFSGYLEGDGDFRSAEVTALRDEADIIITNPPFSLWREFLAWIIDGKKQFVIMGNQNEATCKEVFPLLQDNKIWYGDSIHSGGIDMRMPDDLEEYSKNVFIRDGHHYVNLAGIRWFTNIDHGGRHRELLLDTAEHNLKYNKKLIKKCKEDFGRLEYPRYDNYEAIEVPFSDAIPSDYDDVMGVPTTFLDKYNPEQFEIIGTVSAAQNEGSLNTGKSYKDYIGYKQDGTPNGRTGSTFGKCPVIVKDDGKHPYYEKDGVRVQATYPRIFIKHKKGGNA